MCRIFIDPASISSGWCYTIGGRIYGHGTIATKKTDDVWTRLGHIWSQYHDLLFKYKIDEMHIEQLPRMCHIYTHYSVAIIGHAAHCRSIGLIKGDIPVKAWQKAVDWNGKRDIIKANRLYEVKSEDEDASIGMAIYYLRKELGK